MKVLIALSLALALAFAPAAGAATPQQDKVAFIFLEKMGKGRFENLDRIYAPGFRAHAGDKTVDLEGDNESGRAIRAAVPDLQVAILRMVEQGPIVAVHWRAKGTNSVAGAGMPGKGARLSLDGMTFFRFEDGRIAEEWSLTDEASLMRQLSD